MILHVYLYRRDGYPLYDYLVCEQHAPDDEWARRGTGTYKDERGCRVIVRTRAGTGACDKCETECPF